MNLTKNIKAFTRDDRGQVAIMFGLGVFATFGIVGGAIDVGRAIAVKSAMQEVADYAALSVAAIKANDIQQSTNFTSGSTSEAQAEALTAAQARAASLGAKDVTFTMEWENSTDLKVLATARYTTVLMTAVPGLPDSFNITAEATARSNAQLERAASPSRVQLSDRAADYNQVWVYCYDKDFATKYTNSKKARDSDEGSSKTNQSGDLAFTKDMASRMNKNGRADFTLIADNGGSTISFSMPTCAEGEVVSYALFNSRNSRTSPANWKKNYSSCGTSLSQTGKACYQWFTDTKRSTDGTESYSTSPYQLETVLCDDPQCDTVTSGDVNGPNAATLVQSQTELKNRIPIKAKGCDAGKYMYLGWEDRPPQNQGGQGKGDPYPVGQSDPGGDRDYDDIRVVVHCPQFVPGQRSVKLIK